GVYVHRVAGAYFEVQRRHILDLLDVKDLFDGTNRTAGPKDLLHHVHQLRAPVGAHHHVDAGDGGDLVGRVLYVAPHRDHHGPGIPADGPADHLPGLLRRLIGDAAGVDHVHVRGLVEIDHLVPATPEEGGHALGVVEVYLAAQGRERDPAHPFRAALRPARGRVADLDFPLESVRHGSAPPECDATGTVQFTSGLAAGSTAGKRKGPLG